MDHVKKNTNYIKASLKLYKCFGSVVNASWSTNLIWLIENDSTCIFSWNRQESGILKSAKKQNNKANIENFSGSYYQSFITKSQCAFFWLLLKDSLPKRRRDSLRKHWILFNSLFKEILHNRTTLFYPVSNYELFKIPCLRYTIKENYRQLKSFNRVAYTSKKI